MDELRLHKSYTIAWLVLVSSMVINEIYIGSNVVWDTLFVLVMAVELIAAYRKGKGDTLSEHVWVFTTGWPRYFLVGGFTTWMCYRFAHLGTGELDFGRISLSLGLYLWLLTHWLTKGKYE